MDVDQKDLDKNEILDTCLLAGRIMIEGGSEMYRVEDTMKRIAINAGEDSALIFTTATGIFASVRNQPYMQLRPVQDRDIDMEKVARVNTLSRRFAAKEIDLNDLHTELEHLEKHIPYFPMWLQLIGAAAVSALLMVVFTQHYDWFDIPLAGVAGAIGFGVSHYIHQLTNIKFVSELTGSLALAAVTLLGIKLGLGHNMDNILIGAVMPLVPGVAITNSIRDMLAGHLLTGMARGMEAVLTACAIGFGIAIVIMIA
ncbi:threonine/serine exporter family protein [Lacticaseibacillus pabuli]|uniref:Threonine/serine exporter family protein n=1 Tax=Lacticaseibacillus pabuli TaxID=3025672 RepID=A0ABY7WQQ5_9LACO|nr:threonine/serine exporter family protein [Lacticaseibacillus sp. KACC 23028]WDF82514.1 threonine/serine exporter family protein [Lacticaseibacillus sp. KACC 23028]